MDERVARLKTPAECVAFAKNATRLDRQDLVLQTRQKSVELRAAAFGAQNDAERECIEAIYAYEETLSAKHGRRQTAGRTWPMVKKYGVLEATERAVNRKDATTGFAALKEAGLERYAFEAVILRHPHLFSESTVAISQTRMDAALS